MGSEFQKSTLQIQPEEESLRENSENLDKVDNLDDLTLEDLKLIKDTPSFDSKFFEKKEVKVFIKGQAGLHNKINSQNGPGQLGHKKLNRTKNKNKREKARRLRKNDDEDD